MYETTAFFESFYETLLERVREVVQEALAEQRPAEPPQQWLNAKSAAAYLDMSEDALRALIKRGQLQPYRTPTGGLRFRREQLDAWVASGELA